MTTTSTNIVPVNIEDEIQQSYMDYAMSVIVGRALPEVRDGLKPVHRRILFAQHELGNRFNAAYKKSARIVGDVIGKYHPHGDSAVYDALVRMAQDFNMRVPLVDGQGNFGSVDGDPAAAMRYTEVRMSRITQEMLSDLDKETVDMVPNYDDTLFEPFVLPTRVPNLLVNGATGIAVGMSTNIPPHNLGEVVDALIAMVDDPEISIDGLMEIIPGPDFPTGGIIYGAQGIHSAYHTGRGIIKVRAVTEVEIDERTNKPRIIVHELPFQVNKARLLEKIAGLVREKRIDGITDLRDESDRQGMRVVIELRRDVVPEVILNNLFKMTSLQSSFGIIMLAIAHGQPQTMTLKEVLEHFVDFRRDVITRRTIYELGKAEERAHILEGLRIALDQIDAVITLIRASADTTTAREGLISEFGLSEMQSRAILEMRLQKLTGLERDKVVEELEALRVEIGRLRSILNDEVLLMGVIREELLEVREKYSDERRTQISYSTSDLSIEDLIAEEQVVVTITHAGYIKRTSLDEYQAQRRGGRGKRGMKTKDEDFVEDLFVASTHSDILVFTSIGKVYTLRVHQLPSGARTTKGKAIVNLLPVEDGERVQAVLPVNEFVEDHYVLTATRNGVVKKTDLMAYSKVLSVGIIALSLKEGDELVSVRITTGEDYVLLTSREGQAILFSEGDVRSMGRTAAGVYGMRFKGDDYLIGMEIVPREAVTLDGEEPPVLEEGEEPLDAKILTVTEHGYGKRTEISEHSVQGRGGKGVITIKTSERNGRVVGCRLVSSDDELMLITDKGQIIRMSVSGISVIGRNTQGVTLMTMDDDEKVVGLARVVREDDEDELEDGELEDGELEGVAEDSEDAVGDSEDATSEE